MTTTRTLPDGTTIFDELHEGTTRYPTAARLLEASR